MRSRLFGGLTVDELYSDLYQSRTRNKLIAEIFKSAENIEKYGSGIKRVIETFKEYGLDKPKFKVMLGRLNVIVFRGTTQEKIIHLLREQSYYARKDLVRITGKGDATIKEQSKVCSSE